MMQHASVQRIVGYTSLVQPQPGSVLRLTVNSDHTFP